MAVQYIGTSISGLAADTKPTPSGNEKGLLFVETDTNKLYQWDTDSWNLLSNAASQITVTDNESTNENNLISFVAGAGTSTGLHGLEMDGDLTYNPSTGRLSATQLAGTLQTAAQTNITSVGALDAGSITSNFGAINVGSSNITTSGTISAGNLTVTGTTTTINSTTITAVDPIMVLQTASGGGSLTSDTNKDVGLSLQYYSGSAKTAFLGWDDSAGKLTFIADATLTNEVASGTAGTIVAALEGNATTATTLATARTIGGVSFDGSANINLPGVNAAGTQDTSGTAAIATTVTLNGSGNVTYYPTFVDATSGNENIRVDSDWTYNASTNKMTVGNIAVSTTIGHTADTDLLTLANGALTVAGTVTSSGQIKVSGSTGSGVWIDRTNSANSYLRLSNTTDANGYVGYEGTNMVFNTANNTRMTLNSTNLTLGDGLAVDGYNNAATRDNVAFKSQRTTGNATYLRIGRYGTGDDGMMQIGNNYNRNSGFAADNTSVGVSAIQFETNGSLDFQTAAAGQNQPTSRMVISNTGKVGIGTDTPTTLLEVKDTGATAGICITADNASFSDLNMGDEDDVNIQRIRSDHSNNSLDFYTNNAERMTLASGGYLGIGVANGASAPSTEKPLTVTNPIGTAQAFVSFRAYAGNYRLMDFVEGSAGDGYMRIKSQSSNKVQLNSNGVSFFNGGNLGIGESSPTSPLHVVHASQAGSTNVGYFAGDIDNNAYLMIENTDNDSSGAHAVVLAKQANSNAGDPKLMVQAPGVTWAIGADNSDSDVFKISGHANLETNNYFKIDGTGNVFIPDGTLYVTSGTTNTVAKFISGDADAYVHIEDSDSTSDYPPGLHADGDDLYLRAGGNTNGWQKGLMLDDDGFIRMRGHVAFGNNSLYDVGHGDSLWSSAGIVIGGTSKVSAASGALNLQDRLFINNNGSTSLWHAPGAIAIISDDNDNQTDSDIIFGTNSTTNASGMDELMRITDEGLVGIGIAPSYKLHVNGATYLAGDAYLNHTGNKIEASASYNMITSQGYMRLQSNSSVYVALDQDNGGTDAVFAVRANGSGTNVFSVSETGLLRITGGTPGVGKVLTSDADGDATWEDAGGGGLVEYDVWSLSSSATNPSDGTLNTNLIRWNPQINSESVFEKIGTGMSKDGSGNFTFPSTGKWEVTIFGSVSSNGSTSTHTFQIHMINDGVEGTIGQCNLYGQYIVSGETSIMLDITDTSNQTIHMYHQLSSSGITLYGDDKVLYNGMKFKKMGDT